MGIAGLLPNLRSVQRPVHVREYSGKRVAVDGYCWLHRGAFSCSRELCEGRPTRRYVDYCLKLVAMMQACGVIPLIVFDGGKLPMKLAEEDGRDRSRREYHEKAVLHLRSGNTTAANECFQRAVDIAPWMAAEVVTALRAIGVECIVAPYEADSQMAYLALNGFVHALVTEDSDLLVYGCPRVLFKMDHAGMGFEIRSKDLPLTREILLSDFTADQFLEMCIMSGCDYLNSVSGVGVKKAHSYISRFKTHSKAIRHMRLEGLRVDKGYEERFAEAILTFRHQWVYCPTAKELVNLTPVPVDVDMAGLRRLIGDGHPPDIAHGIAVAQLDPVTCQPFSQLAADGGAASEVPPGLKKQSSRPKPSSKPLPIQKNTLSNYFRLPKSAEAAKPFAAPRMSAAAARAARAHNSTSGERAAQGELEPASSYGVARNERAEGVAKEDRPHKRPCLAARLVDPAWAREEAVVDQEDAVEDRGTSDGDLSPVVPHPMAWTAPSKRASVVLSASRPRFQFQKPRSIHLSDTEGPSSSNTSAKFAPMTTSRFFKAPVPKLRLITAKNDAAAALSSLRPTGPPLPAASPTSPHPLRATATDMKLITDHGSVAHCRELGEKATTALDRLEAKAQFESFRCRASPVLASPSPMPSFARLHRESDIFSDELNDAPPSRKATPHGRRQLPLFDSFTYTAPPAPRERS